MDNQNQSPSNENKPSAGKNWYSVFVAVAALVVFIGIFINRKNDDKISKTPNVNEAQTSYTQTKQSVQETKSKNELDEIKQEQTETTPSIKETKHWYEGGTLQKATIPEWKIATEENKLATSADFMARIYKSVSIDGLKNKAMDLKNCIDNAIKDIKSSDKGKVAGVAGICVTLLQIQWGEI